MIRKYFFIGIQLGIPEHQISEFESNYPEVNRRFSEVISYWLKNSKAVSWDSLITALESPSVNEKKLASELREKYLPSSSVNSQGTVYRCIKIKLILTSYLASSEFSSLSRHRSNVLRCTCHGAGGGNDNLK